jgi:hypothetical protein
MYDSKEGGDRVDTGRPRKVRAGPEESFTLTL